MPKRLSERDLALRRRQLIADVHSAIERLEGLRRHPLKNRDTEQAAEEAFRVIAQYAGAARRDCAPTRAFASIFAIDRLPEHRTVTHAAISYFPFDIHDGGCTVLGPACSAALRHSVELEIAGLVTTRVTGPIHGQSAIASVLLKEAPRWMFIVRHVRVIALSHARGWAWSDILGDPDEREYEDREHLEHFCRTRRATQDRPFPTNPWKSIASWSLRPKDVLRDGRVVLSVSDSRDGKKLVVFQYPSGRTRQETVQRSGGRIDIHVVRSHDIPKPSKDEPHL